MYTRPLLAPLDLAATDALCCTISSRSFIIRTPLCPFPGCGPESPVDGLPCQVTVAGITVSGN